MKLLIPLGLLGLIGIPVLIIIYIIKNKYTEQTVASTYLWTLSERFLKKKNPINRLYNIISLILQILTVACISVSIAAPLIYLPGKANDYYFILDGSGSMNVESDGTTRFERGKKKIEETIASAGNGSVFTLVFVGETTELVYKEITDAERAIELLNEKTVAQSNTSMAEAIIDAQKYFNDTPSAKIYVVTDKGYKNSSNVEIVDVSAGESNVAILSAEPQYTDDGRLKIATNTIAYGKDESVTVTMSAYIDNNTEPSAQRKVEIVGVNKKIDLSENETQLIEKLNEDATEINLYCDGVTSYQSIRVEIADADAYCEDNELIIYNEKSDASFDTLIVSDAPNFLKWAFLAQGYKAKSMTTAEYESTGGVGNYGLYVFDSCTPSAMPEDGAVWFVNPTASVDNSGFSYQNVSDESTWELKYNESTSTVVKTLLEGVKRTDAIYVSKYVKLSTSRDFTTLLTCDDTPVIFAGSNAYGNREAVIAFDLHDSDFPLMYNYVQIINNLLNYTFPPVVDKTDYYCGEVAQINVLANCYSIKVTAPSGKEHYLGTETTVSEITLSEVGLYDVEVKIGKSAETASTGNVKLYSQAPVAEGVMLAEEESFVLAGEPDDNTRDGVYDNLIWLYILLAVIFVADWMVYNYEQYQLR